MSVFRDSMNPEKHKFPEISYGSNTAKVAFKTANSQLVSDWGRQNGMEGGVNLLGLDYNTIQ